VNSNQFLSLLKKGNDLHKEDFQQLVKLHDSFPYFQIPAILAAKYELQNSKQESSELLHVAAVLSPNRSRLKYIVEEKIGFLDTEDNTDTLIKTIEPTANEETIAPRQEDSTENVESEKIQLHTEDVSAPINEDNSQISEKEEEVAPEPVMAEPDKAASDVDEDQMGKVSNKVENDNIEEEKALDTAGDLSDSRALSEESTVRAAASATDQQEVDSKEEEKSNMITSPSEDQDSSRPDLITNPYGGDAATRPDLILPYAGSEKTEPAQQGDQTEVPKTEEEEQPIIKPINGPPSSRQDILKQLEDNLARLKSESDKNRQEEKPTEAPKPGIIRRKRSGDDLIDSIKKKEKREIKDTKKKEQNDIIKAFNKKSIKLAAIKENEDVNKLQDLSLPSTKINDRMVSESYAKLLTQQGKKAAAKEIYKKLILKFPQKKAYFADLIQQLEE